MPLGFVVVVRCDQTVVVKREFCNIALGFGIRSTQRAAVGGTDPILLISFFEQDVSFMWICTLGCGSRMVDFLQMIRVLRNIATDNSWSLTVELMRETQRGQYTFAGEYTGTLVRGIVGRQAN